MNVKEEEKIEEEKKEGRNVGEINKEEGKRRRKGGVWACSCFVQTPLTPNCPTKDAPASLPD